jgi:hypothetical protein
VYLMTPLHREAPPHSTQVAVYFWLIQPRPAALLGNCVPHDAHRTIERRTASHEPHPRPAY